MPNTRDRPFFTATGIAGLAAPTAASLAVDWAATLRILVSPSRWGHSPIGLLRLVLNGVRQWAVVMEDLGEVTHIEGVTAGWALHEVVGFGFRLASETLADDLAAARSPARYLIHCR